MLTFIGPIGSLTTLGCALLAPLASAEGAPTGLWRTTGYGLYLDIADEARIYQVSAAGCVPMGVASDVSDAALGDLRLPGVGVMLGAMDVPIDVADGVLSMEFGKLNPITATPVPALPDACGMPVDADPQATFDVFWAVFDENYPFFDLRGLDWQAQRDLYRPQVTPDMPMLALRDILGEMVAPLRDGHVAVLTPFGEVNVDGRPAWAEGMDVDDAVALARGLADRHIPEGKRNADDTVRWGLTAEGIGYLWLLGFDAGFWVGEESTLPAEVLDDLHGAKALVIDIRINFGGDDTAGFEIARHLTQQTVLVGDKFVWHDGDWAKLMDLSIVPAGTSHDGPVYLLTSRMSFSAAETFALALSQMPHVTLVGEPTNGIVSDQFFAMLPNGWMASFPNELYRDADGTAYEGTGIPVDVAVPVDPAALKNGEDAAFAAVLDHLAQ